MIRDLSAVFLGTTIATFFTTGQGPGIVNAPIAPDAIYVGMVGSRPGVKIVDLNGFGHEWAEINGSQASAVYRLHEPNTLLLGRTGQDLEPVDVPAEFLSPEGSPRDPSEGEPATVFRYDLVWEFVSAILEQRPAIPSFEDGRRAQLVADSVLKSHESGSWIDLSSQRA